MVPELRFELRLSDSKSGDLPLVDSGVKLIAADRIVYLFG